MVLEYCLMKENNNNIITVLLLVKKAVLNSKLYQQKLEVRLVILIENLVLQVSIIYSAQYSVAYF